MPAFSVILVEPKYTGNIGAIARSMNNFGFKRLILVNPCKLDDDAYKMAMHSKDILYNAHTVDTLDDALSDIDYVIGTSGTLSDNEKHHLRNPMPPREIVERLADVDGHIGIVFGREDFGLSLDELSRCDSIVRVPTTQTMPIMNIASAATVVLYELSQLHETDIVHDSRGVAASVFERNKLEAQFETLLDEILYPPHKKDKAIIVFKRLLGRAVVTEWEFYITMGVIGDAIKMVNDAYGTQKLTAVKRRQREEHGDA